MSRGRSRRS